MPSKINAIYIIGMYKLVDILLNCFKCFEFIKLATTFSYACVSPQQFLLPFRPMCRKMHVAQLRILYIHIFNYPCYLKRFPATVILHYCIVPPKLVINALLERRTKIL